MSVNNSNSGSSNSSKKRPLEGKSSSGVKKGGAGKAGTGKAGSTTGKRQSGEKGKKRRGRPPGSGVKQSGAEKGKGEACDVDDATGWPTKSGSVLEEAQQRGYRVILLDVGVRYIMLGDHTASTPQCLPLVLARRKKQTTLQAQTSSSSTSAAASPSSPSSTSTTAPAEVTAFSSNSMDTEDDQQASVQPSIVGLDEIAADLTSAASNRRGVVSTARRSRAPELVSLTSHHQSSNAETIFHPRVRESEFHWTSSSEEVLYFDEAISLPSDREQDYITRYPLIDGPFDLLGHEVSSNCYSYEAASCDLHALLDRAFTTVLRIPRQEMKNTRVIVSVRRHHSRLSRLVKMLHEVFFNRLALSAVMMHRSPVLSAFGARRTTACVITLGTMSSTVDCVEEGCLLPSGHLTVPYGTYHMDYLLLGLLRLAHVPYLGETPPTGADFADAQHRFLVTQLRKSAAHLHLSLLSSPDYTFSIEKPPSTLASTSAALSSSSSSSSATSTLSSSSSTTITKCVRIPGPLLVATALSLFHPKALYSSLPASSMTLLETITHRARILHPFDAEDCYTKADHDIMLDIYRVSTKNNKKREKSKEKPVRGPGAKLILATEPIVSSTASDSPPAKSDSSTVVSAELGQQAEATEEVQRAHADQLLTAQAAAAAGWAPTVARRVPYGFDEAVQRSIGNLSKSAEVKARLFRSIILSGEGDRGAVTPGLADLLESRLFGNMPPGINTVSVVNGQVWREADGQEPAIEENEAEWTHRRMQSLLHPDYLAWRGARVITELTMDDSGQSMWVHRKQWQVRGMKSVREVLPFPLAN